MVETKNLSEGRRKITISVGAYSFSVLTQGAVLNKFTLDGKNAILGFDDYKAYVNAPSYMGEVVGPFANRIKAASFSMDGNEYLLDKNDGNNNLHSGSRNYGDELFEIAGLSSDSVTLALISKERAGFPGNHEVMVTYLLSEDGVLSIDYQVRSDKRCPVSVTNHAYFNLAGESAGNCLDHRIQLKADRRTEIGADMAPTGNCPTVAGTPYDLNSGKSFREILEALPNGFDDNFILSDVDGVMKRDVVVASADSTGIELRVATSAPGIQFYMGYFLNGSAIGKNGKGYPQFSAFCLEAQRWPDAVNHPDFPSMRLEPGRPYKQTTVYQFGLAK